MNPSNKETDFFTELKTFSFKNPKNLTMGHLGGDYMIPACRDEISTRPAKTDFTLQLHVKIKFRPGEAG